MGQWSRYNGLIQRLIRQRLVEGRPLEIGDRAEFELALEATTDPSEPAAAAELTADEKAEVALMHPREQQRPRTMPRTMGFLQLKKHLLGLGLGKQELDRCPGKPELLRLYERTHDHSAAGAPVPAAGSPPAAAEATGSCPQLGNCEGLTAALQYHNLTGAPAGPGQR